MLGHTCVFKASVNDFLHLKEFCDPMLFNADKFLVFSSEIPHPDGTCEQQPHIFSKHLHYTSGMLLNMIKTVICSRLKNQQLHVESVSYQYLPFKSNQIMLSFPIPECL